MAEVPGYKVACPGISIKVAGVPACHLTSLDDQPQLPWTELIRLFSQLRWLRSTFSSTDSLLYVTDSVCGVCRGRWEAR